MFSAYCQYSSSKIPSKNEVHIPNIGEATDVDPFQHWCFVHLPLKPKVWMNNPDAKAAVQGEFDNLFGINSFDLDNPKEYDEVELMACADPSLP